MDRRLIIDGNAVYELDENCMLRKHLDTEEQKEEQKGEQKRRGYDGCESGSGVSGSYESGGHKMKRTE